MNWDRVCFCSWFNADEAYGWVWIGMNWDRMRVTACVFDQDFLDLIG